MYSKRGLIELVAKAYEAAPADFGKKLEMDPKSASAWINKGNTLLALEKKPEALAAYRRATEVAPHSPAVWVSLGQALVTDTPQEAMTAFDRALALDPQKMAAKKWKGLTFLVLERYPDSIILLKEATQADPNDVEGLTWLGNAYLNSGKQSEARGTETSPSDYFNWAGELRGILPQIQGFEHWEQLEHHMIAPRVNQILQLLSRQLSGTTAEQWEHWRQRYIPEFLTLLRAFRHEATLRSRAQTEQITRAIGPLLRDAPRAASLSQNMFWILSSTPGVTCVLNGMRTPSYVEDSLAVLNWTPISEPGPIYEAAHALLQ